MPASFQINRSGFLGHSMDAIVVHHRPPRAESEAGPSSDDRAVALHAYLLSRLDRLAGQIHFQFRRPGFILQNEPSLRCICPPDGPFQTDGMAGFGVG